MTKTAGPLRRAQLIAPFGPGAMTVMPDGTAVLTAGLDLWFGRENGEDKDLDLNDFRVEEWRLQADLGVSHFRLPPDYRERRWQTRESQPNTELTVPVLRFPRWHFCPNCQYMKQLPEHEDRRVKCQHCNKAVLNQVPLVAMCEHGHLQEFPWREWVHQTNNPTCSEPMRLVGTGGASLSALLVICKCGEKRNLGGVTNRLPLTTGADSDAFQCYGGRPWLGSDQFESCQLEMRGTLRSASNVYFAQVRSSLYLPKEGSGVPEELLDVLSAPQFSVVIKTTYNLTGSVPTAIALRTIGSIALQDWTDQQVDKAALVVAGAVQEVESTTVDGDDNETAFRRAEYAALRDGLESNLLSARVATLTGYQDWLGQYFSRVTLVDRLRETRALVGFNRVYSESDKSAARLQQDLWLTLPHPEASWLPAYTVFGEGLFLELDEIKLRDWESQPGVRDRLAVLERNFHALQQVRRVRNRPSGPRFVLLHTLAHLLIDRLTFECGYSSASLRERLYVSDNPDHPMAGILIYTAAGDSDGTLGGLVRMGKKGLLEPVLRRALDGARWCSADPVCMEMAEHGQGVNSLNLAACHNCALIPETACEEFNAFLDRGVVVGTIENATIGFFGDLFGD